MTKYNVAYRYKKATNIREEFKLAFPAAVSLCGHIRPPPTVLITGVSECNSLPRAQITMTIKTLSSQRLRTFGRPRLLLADIRMCRLRGHVCYRLYTVSQHCLIS